MLRDVICCLSFCPKDADQALLWISWTIHLSRCAPVRDDELVIVPSLGVSDSHIRSIVEIAKDADSYFKITIQRPHDDFAGGYPGAASWMFCRSLEICAANHPGKAVLWCEPDTVALRATWFHEFKQDYAARKQPFVGLFVKSTRQATEELGFPAYHLTGNAIYPADALERAPSIRQCLTAPIELSPWGEKGQSFDLFCAHEIMPEAEQTPLIQQIWKSDPWTQESMARIDPRAALFHQSKDASLLFCLAERNHPDFIGKLPAPTRRFLMVAPKPVLKAKGLTLSFTPCNRDPGGRLYSVYAPKNRREEMALVSTVGSQGVSEISQDDWEKFMTQANSLRT